MAQPKLIIWGIISLTMFTTFILILCSLSTLGYTEVGLNYSNWFKTVEEKTYKHGIHFIGLGHSFIRFKINLETLEFAGNADSNLPMIKCRTQDGLEISMEASL